MNRNILLIFLSCIFCFSFSYANISMIQKAHVAVDQETNDTQRVAVEATIKEIVEDPEKYENKLVIVSGVCSKINLAIMNRNWIHLKDGSKDDFDFVITSEAKIKKGDRVTIQGVIRLKVDFGFGYNYDVLMQEAEIVE